eukprot:1137562-Rhodomonas_salina.2
MVCAAPLHGTPGRFPAVHGLACTVHGLACAVHGMEGGKRTAEASTRRHFCPPDIPLMRPDCASL